MSTKLFPSVSKPWAVHYAGEIPDIALANCSLYDFILKNNQENLSDIALNYFDVETSFSQLLERIRITASAFQKLGVKEGDIVTICSVTIPEIIYSFYALNLLGAATNAVDPRSSANGIKEYIDEVHSKYVVTIDVAYPKIQQACKNEPVEKVIVVSPADSLTGIKKIAYKAANGDKNQYESNAIKWKNFYASGSEFEVQPVDSEKCALIVHTGGTTGTPKGVMLNARAMNSLVLQPKGFGTYFSRRQTLLNVMPPFIAYGFNCGVHLPLCQGMTAIIIPNLDPETLGSLLLKYKPTHMYGVPSHYQTLAKDPKMKNADLSFFLMPGCGGDAIPVQAEKIVNQFLHAHNCKSGLVKGYGMTETASAACTCCGELNKVGSVGLPLCFTTISAFVEGTEEELPCGKQGEICISAPQVMMGYYNNQEETDLVLKKHKDGKYWMHTGDVGYVDEDGYVFIQSRIKRIIIRPDGFKVFPSAIENVVSKHPAVDRCSVVGMADQTQDQGNLPFVFFTLQENFIGQEDHVINEIETICSDELAEYLQPCGYEVLSDLPYTSIGKVDYRNLEDRVASCV